MHIYRRRARKLAWYEEAGVQSRNLNPFKKYRVQQTKVTHVEDGTVQTHPAGEAGGQSDPPISMGALMTSNNDGQMSGPEAVRVTQDMSTDPSIPREETGKREARSPLGDHDNGENRLEEAAIAEEPPRECCPQFTFVGQFRAALFNSWINLLLVAVPAGLTLFYVDVDPVATFVVNLVAIIPLAAMMSYATQELALRTGDTLGALLDVTFGNAVELIVSLIALFNDEIVIVKTSLLGSILCTLLLVMGNSFFFGGLKRLQQNFNLAVAEITTSIFALAIGSLVIPTAFRTWSPDGNRGLPELSRGTSIILFCVYFAFLLFQLKTNNELYLGIVRPPVRRRRRRITDRHDDTAADGEGGTETPSTIEEEEPQEEEPQLLSWVAIMTLAVTTAVVGLCANALVGSIDGITDRTGLPETFVGLILLPIFENAAEHATAVSCAVKDKMDLAINVALGSAMQIAMLVLPLVVVVGWIAGKDEMTLYFDGFQIAILFVAVLLVNYLIQDGKSNWLEGILLITLYAIIAVAAWYVPLTFTILSYWARIKPDKQRLTELRADCRFYPPTDEILALSKESQR